MPNANFDALLTTTLANYRKTFTDNIFSARPFTKWLMEKGRINMEDGGTKIVEPLIYAENSTVASYSGYDTIALTAQTGITAAEYEWRQLAGSIAISGIEEAKNNGDKAILKLLKARTMQLEETMKDKCNAMFFADGTGNGGKDWLGLAALVGTTTSVGNIDGNVDAWWRSTVESTVETWAATFAANRHTTIYNTVSKGNDHPDLILTTQSGFEGYEKTLTPNMRYTDTKMADSGFQNLMFKAAPVMFDTACTAGAMYFLNSKYIGLTGHSDRWFEQTPFVRPENMDARYALVTAYGNMTMSNRARQGALKAKT